MEGIIAWRSTRTEKEKITVCNCQTEIGVEWFVFFFSSLKRSVWGGGGAGGNRVGLYLA